MFKFIALVSIITIKTVSAVDKDWSQLYEKYPQVVNNTYNQCVKDVF